jgi:MFS family permease
VENPDAKRTVRTFALASFLNDFGADIIYPIWPLFVRSVLGANMAVLGFLDGLGEALVSVSQAVSGYLSDRIRKRKVFVWLGYVCGALSRIGYAFSTAWPHLIPFRVLDRAGKMRGAPRDAIIADVSTAENRGRHFGLLRAMDHLGAVCGVIVCILLFKYLGYRKLFLLAAIPTVIGVVMILLRVKEEKPSEKAVFKGLSFRDLDANFRLYLLLSAVFALGAFSYSFLLVFASEFGYKPAFVPALYLLFSALAAVFSIPFGRLSDRIGRKKVMAFSFILWMLSCLSFIVLKGHAAVIPAFVFYGLHKGALEPVQKTLVAELAPQKFRASALGGYQMVVGLCALPASLAAGLLWETVGVIAPFMLSLGLTAAAFVLLLFVREPKQ